MLLTRSKGRLGGCGQSNPMLPIPQGCAVGCRRLIERRCRGCLVLSVLPSMHQSWSCQLSFMLREVLKPTFEHPNPSTQSKESGHPCQSKHLARAPGAQTVRSASIACLHRCRRGTSSCPMTLPQISWNLGEERIEGLRWHRMAVARRQTGLLNVRMFVEGG